MNGEHLFDDVAKEMLRRQIRTVAEFCGIRIMTYSVLSNHFHLVAYVPKLSPLTDDELLRRYKILYPKPTTHRFANFKVLEAELAQGGPKADAWRRRLLALMGDISPFMKLVKQRFSIWFNKTHHRFGTLWAERFKSVLVEPASKAVTSIAAYVDLNTVRAGLVRDPKDYRFCGYADAVAGHLAAQESLRTMLGAKDWGEAQASYRQILFGTGAGAREGAATISIEELNRVIAAGGRLPLATVLRCRIRQFTNGAALGSQLFVQELAAKYRKRDDNRAISLPQMLPAVTEWGDVTALRRVRS